MTFISGTLPISSDWVCVITAKRNKPQVSVGSTIGEVRCSMQTKALTIWHKHRSCTRWNLKGVSVLSQRVSEIDVPLMIVKLE